jgi:DNA-binding MarR family transcriptional regulator
VSRAPDLPPLPKGVPRTLAHRVANALNSTAIHALRHARVGDRRSGLTPERLSLLSVLVYRGPAAMSALAAAEQLTPQAITRAVTALESEGLVERSAGEQDRRQVVVTATPAGVRLLEAGRRARIDRLAGVLASLDRDELADVDRALALVRRALRQGDL